MPRFRDGVLSVQVAVARDTAYQFPFPMDCTDRISDMTIVLATHAVLFTLMDQLNRISLVQLAGMCMCLTLWEWNKGRKKLTAVFCMGKPGNEINSYHANCLPSLDGECPCGSNLPCGWLDQRLQRIMPNGSNFVQFFFLFSLLLLLPLSATISSSVLARREGNICLDSLSLSLFLSSNWKQ